MKIAIRNNENDSVLSVQLLQLSEVAKLRRDGARKPVRVEASGEIETQC